jgi:histone H1/5
VIGKTKSGRVTKTTAKPAAKKAAPKKKATPKKAAA